MRDQSSEVAKGAHRAGGSAIRGRKAHEGWLDRLLIHWLSLVRGHPITMHFVVAGSIFGLTTAAFFIAADEHPSLTVSILMEAAIVLVSLSITVLLTVLTLRRELGTVHRVIATGSPAATGVLLRL